VARLTPKLVAGYNTYGFQDDGSFSELNRLSAVDADNCDLPGNEFWIGGEIVRNLDEEEKSRLEQAGVHLYANPEQLFNNIADQFLEVENGAS